MRIGRLGWCLSAASILVSATGVFAQKLGHGTETEIAPWRIFAALGLSLLLALGGALALRWKMRQGGTLPLTQFPAQRRLRLVERLRLSHQVDLCLVECDGREFMITTSPRDSRFGPETISRPDTDDV